MIEQLHLTTPGSVAVAAGATVTIARLTAQGDRRRRLQWRSMRWRVESAAITHDLNLRCSIPGLEFLSGPLFNIGVLAEREVDLFATSPGDASGEVAVTNISASSRNVGITLKGYFERDVLPWERAPLELSAPYIRDSGDALVTIDTTPREILRLPAGAGGRGVRLYDLEIVSASAGIVRLAAQGIEGWGGEITASALWNQGARLQVYGFIPAGRQASILATRTTGTATYRVIAYGWTVP